MERRDREVRSLAILIAGVVVVASAGYWMGRHQGNDDRIADREASTSQPPLMDPVALSDRPDAETQRPPVQSTAGNDVDSRSAAADTDLPAAEPQPVPSKPKSPEPASHAPATTNPIPAANDAPIDRDHAMDLFADRIARLEEDSGVAEPDVSAARDLRRFHALPDGGDGARQSERVLSDHLDDWLDSFPADRVDHLALVSVQCRSGSCQILIAGNGIDCTAPAVKEGSFLDSFERSFGALSRETWWQEMGLQFNGMSIDAAGKGSAPDYALWTIYLDDPSSSPPDS